LDTWTSRLGVLDLWGPPQACLEPLCAARDFRSFASRGLVHAGAVATHGPRGQ